MQNKALVFRVKLGVGVMFLILAVVSFLAANGLNEIGVEDAQMGNISVEFKDADIQDVFRVLALKGNVSIVSDPDVKGLITVQITDVPWEKVLDVICRTYGYAYEREGNIIRVITMDKQSQENLVTEVFALNFATAKEVAESVGEMKSDRGRIKYDARANLVIVTDIPTSIYRIGKVIERLDFMTPQVTIEAKIIETTLSDGEDLGIKWNVQASASMSKRPTTYPWPSTDVGTRYKNRLPTGDTAEDFPSTTIPTFPFAVKDDFSFGILDASTFNVLLQAIETRAKTKILSNPRITTMDNTAAKIHVGTDWPIASYTYNEQTDRFVITGWEYKSYGILLEVTPTINKNGYVTLKIHPEISDKQEEIDFQGASVPVLTTQTTEATVMVKDGETLAVGGLLKTKKVMTKTKVPFLGDIPIIGFLFSHKSETTNKTDLLIFITPHIIGSDTVIKRSTIAKSSELEKAVAEVGIKQSKQTKIQDAIDTDDFFKDDLDADTQTDLKSEEVAMDEGLTQEEEMYEDFEVDIDKLLEQNLQATREEPVVAEEPPVQMQTSPEMEIKADAEKEKVTEKEKAKRNKGFLFRRK